MLLHHMEKTILAEQAPLRHVLAYNFELIFLPLGGVDSWRGSHSSGYWASFFLNCSESFIPYMLRSCQKRRIKAVIL